mmetsp:Transcript_15314/g.50093  ORF Transcript_15314/g.50093 Transcript_15314/m.50093 type:complete len:123 (+) Transcript_15314:263-631(+)
MTSAQREAASKLLKERACPLACVRVFGCRRNSPGVSFVVSLCRLVVCGSQEPTNESSAADSRSGRPRQSKERTDRPTDRRERRRGGSTRGTTDHSFDWMAYVLSSARRDASTSRRAWKTRLE